MYALALVPVALVASQAAAFSTHEYTSLFNRADSSSDTPQVPTSCQSDCSAFLQSLQCTVTDVSCFCSDTVNKGVVSCFECALSLEPGNQTLQDQGNAYLKQYENECKQVSQALASLTITMPAASQTAGAGALYASGAGVGGALAAIAAFLL